MTIREDEKKGWKHIYDIDDNDLKDKKIVLNALDLKKWFRNNMDSWWLQIKEGKVCLSYEGFSYEPYYFGKLILGESNKEVLFKIQEIIHTKNYNKRRAKWTEMIDYFIEEGFLNED